MLGGGSAHLKSQHLGGRGRWVSLSSKPDWSTKSILGQRRLHKEILSKKPSVAGSDAPQTWPQAYLIKVILQLIFPLSEYL